MEDRLRKSVFLAIVIVLSALGGAGAVTVYHAARVQQEESDAAAIRLSDHLAIIQLVEKNDARGALRFLTRLADADVMELMRMHRNEASRTSDFGRKTLRSYGRFREANPDFYGVPAYVQQEGRAEYEQNLKSIRSFLDKVEAAREQPQK
jgi:hypothetical protein